MKTNNTFKTFAAILMAALITLTWSLSTAFAVDTLPDVEPIDTNTYIGNVAGGASSTENDEDITVNDTYYLVKHDGDGGFDFYFDNDGNNAPQSNYSYYFVYTTGSSADDSDTNMVNSWLSNLYVHSVVIKAGNGAIEYVFDTNTGSFTGELMAPEEKGISHVAVAYGIPSPSPSPSPSPTPTPTATPNPTATPDPTATPSPTATPDPTATPSPTATPGPTATPSPTATPEVTTTPSNPPVEIEDVLAQQDEVVISDVDSDAVLPATDDETAKILYIILLSIAAAAAFALYAMKQKNN